MQPYEFDEAGGGSVSNKPINYTKYILKILDRWPQIVIFFLLSVTIGYMINRYSTPIYEIKGKFITKKFSGGSNTPIPGMVDPSLFLSGMTEVYEEIPLLKSNDRIASAISKLDFGISYFAKGIVKTTESLKGNGFELVIDSLTGRKVPYGIPVFVNFKNSESYTLKTDNEDWNNRLEGMVFSFGQPYNIEDWYFTIYSTNGVNLEKDKYFFVLNHEADLVREYRNKLNISWEQRGSAILIMKIESELPERDLRFLNAFYEVVEEKGVEDKNEYLDNTIVFIEKQMDVISDSLSRFQEIIDRFKLKNRQLSLGSEFIYARLSQIDQQKAEVLLNQRYFDYLEDYIKSNRSSEVFAPSLIGLDAPLLDNLVNSYIEQKMSDNYQRNEFNFKNPLVSRTDSLRRKLEKNIFESIRSYRKVDNDNLKELDRQADFLYSSIEGLQTEFRELNQYKRLYELNQSLFDLFLKRKTEAAISKASAVSDYQLIDEPSYSRNSIRPDADFNLLLSVALGLLLPVGFFFLKDITNPRVMDKDDLLRQTDIPLLGSIAHSTSESNLVVKEKPRSVVSESFRAVRANLKYLSDQTKQGANTYLITSSVGGEGKTFCSLNLAYTLASSEKRTILIGADLRKPTLTAYLEVEHHKGLSEYLAGFVSKEDIIFNGETPNLFFIGAGSVPPNPSELLASDRMGELMKYLKLTYDYIIIDTSPIGLVSDAMELFQYSDANLLMVRQKVTHKEALKMVNDLYTSGKIKNISVVFNDLELNKRRNSYYGGYGYVYGMGYGGYGYGYYEEDKVKKKRWKLWSKK